MHHLVVGCSTDIELNAPYDRTPVVFSLLDAAQDTQWVRINRTWLGDGNQFDAALIADNSEYPAEALTVHIQERLGGTVTSEWALVDTVIENKSDDGIFYAPEHQMWYFVPEGGLDTYAEYDLSIAIDEEPEVVSSTTNMIAEQIGNITQPPRASTTSKLALRVRGSRRRIRTSPSSGHRPLGRVVTISRCSFTSSSGFGMIWTTRT